MSSNRDISKKNARSSLSTTQSSDGDVANFLNKLNELGAVKSSGSGQGRLIFAMDATMSRQPTWDMALGIQGNMFDAVASTGGTTGGLDVQLVYFRGFGECRSSKWVSDARALLGLMTSVSCRGGKTQIRKVLVHAERETDKKRVNALVYVGDCMEENIDELSDLAGRLGLKGVPVFLFQEGHDPSAERAFRELARLSNGAYCRFNAGAAEQLRELLSAVAVYASGGLKALEDLGEKRGHGGAQSGVQLLLEQLK